jgi:protein-disulfide isomerase
MVTIKILGTTPPCAKCKRAEQEARKAAERFAGQVEVVKLDALAPEAEKYGMIVTPTVVVNEQIVGSGKIVSAEQLAAVIKGILGG